MVEEEAAQNKMCLKVMVRLRPVASDDGDSNGIVEVQKRIVNLRDPAKGHVSQFLFDHVFGANESQAAVFQEAGKPLVEHVLEGYNAAALAYG